MYLQATRHATLHNQNNLRSTAQPGRDREKVSLFVHTQWSSFPSYQCFLGIPVSASTTCIDTRGTCINIMFNNT